VDVIGYGQTEVRACFAVLHYSDGNLIDKEYEIFPTPEDRSSAVSSLLKQYYLSRGFAPRTIFLPFEVGDEELFSQLLSQRQGRKVTIKVPQRGDGARLTQMAVNNAGEEALRATDKEEHDNKVLEMLCKMLGVESADRIEAYDISNISGTDNVAGMVVFENGKPKRSEYKRFKIDNLGKQDDYLSMATVIRRRFQRYLDQDDKFSDMPDLLLIDGGVTHADTASKVLDELNIKANVFGMVKDDRHRTRALVTRDGSEISIDAQPAIFSFIGNIQEETHRYAISYHKKLRSKRLRYSELDGIAGIGDKRKQELLKEFKSLTAIAAAPLEELQRILPRDAALAVYEHFASKREGEKK
jgi:excinuclease ABC subunit C